ncbi:MAG: Gfo/Idh/MocA family oxidoreductase, partial [Lachnospiraceae bacterium]
MNIVVIGLGSMGRRRIRLLQNIAMHDRIIGVDTNEIRVSTISEQYKITCYKSLAEADETIDIQVAFVCTSPISHHTIITECLTRGWHVFTEINLIADDYEQNIRLAREKQLVLFLSSTPIYRAEMKTITRQLQDRKLPVNYIYHVGQYLPDWHPWEDFTQFFVGDKRTNGCREIFAIELPWIIKAFGEVMDIHVIHNRITKLPIDYDDNYLVQLLHADGTSGVLCVDVACRQAVRH